jgi:hypothetical protein
LPEALLPKHTEFLIDKRGYIRARWIAKEGGGWLDIENLLQEIEPKMKIPSTGAGRSRSLKSQGSSKRSSRSNRSKRLN